jgi:hypothetical protein
LPELRWRARRAAQAASVIVRHVVGHGEVVDDRGDRIAGLELAAGATVTDLGRTADLTQIRGLAG